MIKLNNPRTFYLATVLLSTKCPNCNSLRMNVSTLLHELSGIKGMFIKYLYIDIINPVVLDDSFSGRRLPILSLKIYDKMYTMEITSDVNEIIDIVRNKIEFSNILKSMYDDDDSV